MKVTVLGCGGSAGVPRLGGADGRGDWGACDPANPRNRRTRVSALVETAGLRVLIDTSPDLREQFLSAGVSRVDAVLFTHQHADHTHGLDDMRHVARLSGKGRLPVYGDPRTIEHLRDRFSYLFEPREGSFYPPQLAAREVELGVPFRIGERLAVMPFDQSHGPGQWSTGFRVGGFAYSTDAVELPDASKEQLKDLDLWIVGCVTWKPHPTHAHFDKVCDWVRELRPRRTLLTHMPDRLDYEELLRQCPAGVEPAYDGQVVEIDGLP